MSTAPSRILPSVEKLLCALEPLALPRPLAVSVIRAHLAELRRRGAGADFDPVLADLRGQLAALARSRLQPVLNATGILAHTNLGRAPLSAAATEAVAAVARGYSNLEFDMATGERGGRGAYLETGLAVLCGAEAATVVNNCAAALVLTLRHFTAGPRKEVVISRGELIQIGGGFRIPEILEASGATLREVGTTNRTTVDDYDRAIGPETALVLRVHRSNFYLEGFVDSPTLAALSELTRRRAREFPDAQLPLIEDLGSGALVAVEQLAPVASEPQPQASLEAGADLVCFSGDKLLGGPQAGILVGRAPLVAALKRNPLFRALRCDKLVFAGLQATVEAYLEASARRDLGAPHSIPMLAMLQAPVEGLRTRATDLARRLAEFEVDTEITDTRAQVGGGLSRSSIPSVALRLRPRRVSVPALVAALRGATPPVVGFVADDWLHLDLRTVPAEDDARLAGSLGTALTPPAP